MCSSSLARCHKLVRLDLFFSSECLDWWSRWLPQCGNTWVCGGGDQHCWHASGFHLGASDTANAPNLPSWGLCPFCRCKGWRCWAWPSHQVKNLNIRCLQVATGTSWTLGTAALGSSSVWTLCPAGWPSGAPWRSSTQTRRLRRFSSGLLRKRWENLWVAGERYGGVKQLSSFYSFLS